MRYLKIDHSFFEEMLRDVYQALSERCWMLKKHFNPDLEDHGPFPLETAIRQLYEWLIGEGERPSCIEEIHQEIMDLVFYNDFMPVTHPYWNWEPWDQTRFGYFMRCSHIAYALEQGHSINMKELALLLGMKSPSVLAHIRNENIQAQKVDRQWRIQASDALAFIENQTLRPAY